MSRVSVRRFNETPVSDDSLDDIVNAGRWAPTGGNCQSVHFTVITNGEVLAKLRELVFDAFASMELAEGMYQSMVSSITRSKMGKYVYDYSAPVLIVVSNRKDYPNAMADCACALQNMMLEATSLGVGSCWINQLHWLEENREIREYLATIGISADETICGSVALGNYDEAPKPKKRTGMKVDYID